MLRSSIVIGLRNSTRRAPASPIVAMRSGRWRAKVTRLMPGDEAAVRDAEDSAKKLFKGDLRAMSESQLPRSSAVCALVRDKAGADGWAIADFLATNAVVGSKSEATRLIRGGGLSVNGTRVSNFGLRPEDAIHGRYFVIRKGSARITSSAYVIDTTSRSS